MMVSLALLVALAVGPDAQAAPEPASRVQPLTLCVVVDVSASMVQLPGLGFDREAADDQTASVMSGLADLLEAGDRVRFGRIAATVAFGPGFVPAEEAARATRVLTVPETDRYGPSPVWDAVDGALGLLVGEAGRRAVIVWTDGRASGNRLSRHDVARRAGQLSIPVHVVSPVTETVIRLTGTTGVRIRPSVYLEWLAEATGGGFHLAPFEAARPLGNPLEAMREILAGLRARERR